MAEATAIEDFLRPLSIADAHAVYVVGDRQMIALNGRYDPRQMWLEFVTPLIFVKEEPPRDPPLHKRVPEAWLTKEYATLEDHDRIMYPGGYPNQYVLPYVEHKRVSNAGAKRLGKNFPNWERTDDGKLCQVPVTTGESNSVIEEWCNANFDMRYKITKKSIICESMRDAIMAKLRFH